MRHTATLRKPRRTKSKARTLRASSVAKRNTLATQHDKLVHHVAKRFRAPGVDYHDLVQEGRVGLLKAADRFRPKKGRKFSTYAVPWIKKHVVQALRKGFTVPLPEKKVRGLKKGTVRKPEIVGFNDLHTAASEGGIGLAYARAQVHLLRKRIDKLPAKHGAVLRARYFSDHHVLHTPATMRMVSKKLKMSVGNVSRLERQAMHRLRGARMGRRPGRKTA